MIEPSPQSPVRRRRVLRLLALGVCAGVALSFAQRMFAPPAGAEATVAGPSVYVNTYVPGESFANTVLYYGARHSAAAAHATVYAELRSPAAIVRRIKTAAAEAGAPLVRVTIAGHGKPGGVLLNRDREEDAEGEWLLTSYTLIDWLDADVASAVAPDATVVFEACDTNPIVQGAPAAEATAFRRAVAATFGIPPQNVVLFRGPAKYAWGLDGWVPRTYPLEIVFGAKGQDRAA